MKPNEVEGQSFITSYCHGIQDFRFLFAPEIWVIVLRLLYIYLSVDYLIDYNVN